MDKEKLKEFNQILLKMKQSILEQTSKLSNTIQGGAGKETHLSDQNDRASAETDTRVLLRLGDRNRKLLLKIDEALKRIKDGTYGVCEICGEEISEERLRYRPVTTQCIRCKTELEDEEKQIKQNSTRWPK